MRTVEQGQVASAELGLPPSVQEAFGELVNAAKDGLLALSVGVGLGVLSEMMEAELDDVVGPKHARLADRTAVRHGHEAGEVTLGGRRVVKLRLRKAWASENHELALDGLNLLATELERSHPGAAASLREGLEETLTLTRLGIRGDLKQRLQSTDSIESMIECVRRTSRNVKRWQSGDMCLRWTAAGMLEAEQQFRRITGYADLAKLAIAVERDLAATRAPVHTTSNEEAATLVTVS